MWRVKGKGKRGTPGFKRKRAMSWGIGMVCHIYSKTPPNVPIRKQKKISLSGKGNALVL
jgi:hypothetical protein